MPLVCENSWAGRLVISLQLLSWCAVGVLLLHRGISSVKPEANISTSTLNVGNLSKPDSSNNTQLEPPTTKSTFESKIVDKSSIIDKHILLVLKASANSLGPQESNSSTLMNQTVENVNARESPVKDSVNASENSTRASPSPKMTQSVTHNVRVSTSFRKSLVLTPSGVVMAALGAIMLILGPSIVILRCCDAGRQGRFSKLSADDYALAMSALDRPPSYDDVADNAPRYSTLFPEEMEISEDAIRPT